MLAATAEGHDDDGGAGGLRPADFAVVARLVGEICGIALGPNKRTMLEGRLRRRLRALGLDGFGDYVALLEDPERGLDELQELIDCVTTNQTAFWREPQQLEYLLAEGVAQVAAATGGGTHRPLRAWSAACSSGEEPYCLAMLLAERQRGGALPRGFSVLATDISRAMLDRAKRAVYPADAAEPLPPALHARYVLRARDRRLGVVRIAPELRAAVRFGFLNLIDATFRVGEPFDLVLCRNVLIYFEPAMQARILGKLCRHLRGGGLLCLGHADNTMGLRLPLRQLRANTYVRLGEDGAA